LETPFARAFVLDIYVYKWKHNFSVIKSFLSFSLFPCVQFIFMQQRYIACLPMSFSPIVHS